MLDGALSAYYAHAFPARLFALWLGYGRTPLRGAAPCAAFRHREFAFTFGEVYTRFRCFEDVEALREFLVRRVPARLELGAVYTERPDQPLLGRVVAEREFVIDIDLTDMAATGQLHTTATDPADPAFAASWRLLVVAVRTLDALLRECFGFRHVLWVFSGRRGVHCWVADERARRMDSAARAAVTAFLSLDRSAAAWAEFAGGANLHPALAAAAESVLVSPQWEAMLAEQGWLAPERRERALELLVDEHLRTEARGRLAAVSVAGQKNARLLWHTLRSVVRSPRNAGSLAARRRLHGPAGADVGRNVLRALVLGLAYPVLDGAVSRAAAHLLKAPFAVHPATGRVCVPLDPATMDALDPAALPTAAQAAADPARLAPFVATFRERFLAPLHREHVRRACAKAGM
jgi:DNA primase small subunit